MAQEHTEISMRYPERGEVCYAHRGMNIYPSGNPSLNIYQAPHLHMGFRHTWGKRFFFISLFSCLKL